MAEIVPESTPILIDEAEILAKWRRRKAVLTEVWCEDLILGEHHREHETGSEDREFDSDRLPLNLLNFFTVSSKLLQSH
ncbi:MAG: hypothetical protein CVU64_11865 [Deltaproteobacteria bacterium HGW-Deltaproteobacteria-21]|nr:MAG: hypothetical protein CVU64_11865 [Deltaproteobacteria bacterium HGW-Deltaproteobacteria-21]